MNGFAGIFGGLLGYAIGHINTGLEQWQYIFLIFGCITIAWSITFLIFMPDLPSTARFLTPQERRIAVERVASNRSGIKNHTFKKYQVRQAFIDPKTWILFIMAVSALPSSFSLLAALTKMERLQLKYQMQLKAHSRA